MRNYYPVKPLKLSAYFSRLDWFSATLLLMILAARFFPEPSMYRGLFSLKSFSLAGISVIFFLYGLRLSLPQMLKCVNNWKLHVLIQATTFLVFPLIVLPGYFLFKGSEYYDLWLGVFFLATLPSTVSSAVVMVSLAGGNVPGSIFNATFSSIAGILITPLWMGLFLAADAHSPGLGIVFQKLAIQILLPLFIGITLHRWFGSIAIKYKDFTRYFDQLVILSVVYTSFCSSFSQGLFDDFNTLVILVLLFFLILLFVIANLLIVRAANFTGLPLPDKIAALFCGSTKSLMHGSVMAGVMFAATGKGGVLLLPVLIYHAMQLTFTGFMSQKFRRESRSQAQ